MSVTEELLKALQLLPQWKRITAAPDDIDRLRERVEALERRLAPSVGDICPKCRAASFMLLGTAPEPGPFGRLGARIDSYRCSSCGYTDDRSRKN